MSILIKNATILPMDSASGEPLYFKGNIFISGNKIEYLGTDLPSELKAESVIDASGKVVMPGLINAHTHVSMTLLRGYADDMPLMPWLTEKIFPFEATLNAEDIALGAKLGIYEMLLGGTTSFVDMYYSSDAIYDVVEQTGIRAMLSPALVDFNKEGYQSEIEALIQRQTCSRVKIALAPHSVYTVSEDNLKFIKNLSDKHSLPIHIHLSETTAEQQITKEKYNCTPTELLDKVGLLSSKTLAAHGIYLSEQDMKLLRKSGTSVVHNPQSNMKLASGIAPISKLLEKGINVALGTDGASSNNDLDMWEEMRSAGFLQKVATLNPCTMNAYELLKLATVNGAKAMGRDDLGVIKQGNIADLIIIDTQKPHLYPQHDLVANLAYCAKASDVDTVIVDGHVLVKDSKLVGVDMKAALEQYKKGVDEILSRQKS